MKISRRAFGALAVAGAVRAQQKDFDEQVVFAAGEGGYHTYRIPALLVTAKGTALAFAEARKDGRGDSGAIDMVVKRSEDGGRGWSKPLVVWSDGGNTCGNPCPVVVRDSGRILLPMNLLSPVMVSGWVRTGCAWCVIPMKKQVSCVVNRN